MHENTSCFEGIQQHQEFAHASTFLLLNFFFPFLQRTTKIPFSKFCGWRRQTKNESTLRLILI